MKKVAPRIKIAGSTVSGKLCSICQTQLISGEEIVYCPDCNLPFHSECWNENTGCSQYGCKSAPETIKTDTVAEFTSEVWGDEKKCPQCGKNIKARAVKCRFCGAEFSDRGYISSSDFKSREYEDAELLKARNTLIGLFLLSSTGCLSPIAIIILVVLYASKKLSWIEYNRLPSVLKWLVIISIALNVFLILSFTLLVVID